jgi:hypothetical protein
VKKADPKADPAGGVATKPAKRAKPTLGNVGAAAHMTPEMSAQFERMADDLERVGAEFRAALEPALKQLEPSLARMEAELGTPNGAGWRRLYEILEQAGADPEVLGSVGASTFVRIITHLAGDS